MAERERWEYAQWTQLLPDFQIGADDDFVEATTRALNERDKDSWKLVTVLPVLIRQEMPSAGSGDQIQRPGHGAVHRQAAHPMRNGESCICRLFHLSMSLQSPIVKGVRTKGRVRMIGSRLQHHTLESYIAGEGQKGYYFLAQNAAGQWYWGGAWGETPDPLTTEFCGPCTHKGVAIGAGEDWVAATFNPLPAS